MGAALVATTRGEVGHRADPLWIALALLIPVSLAGSIYRTADWPDGAGPIELAVGSHFAAAAMLLLTVLLLRPGVSFALLGHVLFLTLVQVIAGAAVFACFFRLQALGGPVYLSQIGYAAAAVGLAAGVLFLGQRYSPLTWAGAAIAAAGVILTSRAQARPG